jgi:hypothetical protein
VREELAQELLAAVEDPMEYPWLYWQEDDGTYSSIGTDFQLIAARPDVHAPPSDGPTPHDPRLPVPGNDGYVTVTYEQYARDMIDCHGPGGHWGQSEELWLASRRYGINFVSIAEMPFDYSADLTDTGYGVELFPARDPEQMNLVPMSQPDYKKHLEECAISGADPITVFSRLFHRSAFKFN